MSSPLRTLVLGATGFLGSQLCRVEVAAGHDVTGISLDDAFVEGVHGHTFDMADGDKLAALLREVRPDRIFYLAALAFEPRDDNGLRELTRGNVELAARVGQLLHETGFAGRLVLASSCSLYGIPADPGGRVYETDAPNPVLAYGLSKHLQETQLAFYARRGDFEVAFARLFNLTGPGEPARLVAAAMCERAAQARCDGSGRFDVGNSSTVRDFLDVRDAATGLVALMDSDITGPVHLSSGRPVAIHDLADKVRDLARLEGWDELELLKRPYDVPAIYGEARSLHAVGWSPAHTLDDSLRAVWDEAVQRAQDGTNA